MKKYWYRHYINSYKNIPRQWLKDENNRRLFIETYKNEFYKLLNA